MSHSAEEPPVDEATLSMAQFVMLGRVYDALMLDISLRDPVSAGKLADIHKAGHLMTSAPNFTGLFIGDLNEEDMESTLTNADAKSSE